MTNTCMAVVYVSLWFMLFVAYTTYRYMAGDLRNVALLFLQTTVTRALNLSSSDPKFKHHERFINNVRISIPSPNGQRTKTIRDLIERAGKFILLKNDGQESTVAVCLFISSSHSIPLLNIVKLYSLYFQETYNIRIRYPDMLNVNISSKKNLYPSVIPAELCQVIMG